MEEPRVRDALKKGEMMTKLSAVFMGLGNITHKQVAKGLMFLFIEAGYLFYMLTSGIQNLLMLPSLGENAQQEIWNESLGIYEYVAGDNSLLILLYGIATLFLSAGFLLIWRAAVKSAYMAECKKKEGVHISTFSEDIKALFNQNLHKLLLSPPIIGIVIFTVLPLIFMMAMAFTDYSKVNERLILFDWVGFSNFAKVLNFKDSIGQTFWSVLGWTLIWAFFATVLNYVFGMLLAIVINRKTTVGKSFWRFCFVLSIAVPQFVSLLIMRTMLQPEGAINVILKNAGIITKSLPFLSNWTWARVTVIVINLWVGVPYTMIQVTGILKNIPAELYEAARVDGANPVVMFFKITLPYMLFVTTPYLITTFTGNINNFNVIYLLTRGEPVPVGSTAGKTDLLVTWLYKLTIEYQYFNLGAVVGIMTFVVLAIVSIITYRSSASYKNEEGFQ